MDKRDLEQLLSDVAGGSVTPADALTRIQTAPTADLGFAQLDLSRGVRQGAGEVVYGAGKTAEQIAAIIKALLDADQERILVTRLDAEKAAHTAELLGNDIDLGYVPDAQLALVGGKPSPTGNGRIVVACAGTSDLPVAEEAALTAEFYGNEVDRLYDVGVAGLHRLLAHAEELAQAQVVIAIAGMEGALASVIGGLVSCPVIAVPTSVGYGASFGGVAALLAMLNSCASGVSVVNIDNGFGAAYQASLINHLSAGTPTPAKEHFMSNHQHTLIIDGTSGISGDMTVAALLDLGASEEHLREQLATLPVDGFEIAVTRVNKHGIDAYDFDVQLAEELENHDHDMAWLYGNEAAAEHTHEHEHHHHDHGEHEHCHEHAHDHEGHAHEHEDHHHAHHHHHRSLADVTTIIDGSQLSDGAKRRALAIFTALAAAEAKAHGKTPETVMFHEVGAIDSIVDICSVAICLDDLGIEDIVVESLSEGHGTIHCAHGLMPIPVPAVVNLCQAGNIALTPAPVAGELVTPTGAAIVAALRTSEHLPARYRIEAVGYGAGKRPYEGCSGTLRCLLVHVDA